MGREEIISPALRGVFWILYHLILSLESVGEMFFVESIREETKAIENRFAYNKEKYMTMYTHTHRRQEGTHVRICKDKKLSSTLDTYAVAFQA